MCQHSDPRSSATLPTANGTHGLRRESGKCMLKWTSRFEGFVKRTGAALHQADANIDADTFLHPLILGIMLLECSRLTPQQRMLRYWQHLEQQQRREAQSVIVTCLKLWSQGSVRSGTMKQFNVATGHLLKDVQHIFGRSRVIVGAPAGLSPDFRRRRKCY